VYELSGCTPGYAVTVRRATPEDAEALVDWADVGLQGDYFFRRGHLVNLLTKPAAAVWVVIVDGYLRGLMILYRGSMLHNLYLAPEVRQLGIGRALLALFRPAQVRAKTNMLAGDPTPFYQANGYGPVGPDPERPHIQVMQRLDQHAAAQALPQQPVPPAQWPPSTPMLVVPPPKAKRQVSEATKQRLRALAQQQKLDRARATLAAAGELPAGPTPAAAPHAVSSPAVAVAPTLGATATGTPSWPSSATNGVTSDRTVTADDGSWALPPQMD
jgi:GNAT superfamily N-acetyltransferase